MRLLLLPIAAFGLSGCLAVVPIPIGNPTDPIVIGGDAGFVDDTPGEFDDMTFLALVNVERGNASVQPVVYNDLLTEAAQGHADDMVARNYIDHVNPEGQGPGERVAETGYAFDTVWENIFLGIDEGNRRDPDLDGLRGRAPRGASGGRGAGNRRRRRG